MNLDKQAAAFNAHSDVRKSLDRLASRDLAALRQTIWHVLERTYLAGFEAAEHAETPPR